MGDMLEYIKWRGDLPFSMVPPNEVDGLIFSTFVYMDLTGLVGEELEHPVPLDVMAEAFFALPDHESRVRTKADLTLLKSMSQSERFQKTRLTFFRSIFIPQEETQFAAMTFLLDDGSAFLTFRGTDSSLVGWKEDFNLSFQDFVPAQLEAQKYTQEFAAAYPLPMHLCGHSKGGNLAVFAAASSDPEVQKRIVSVYNNDGPGVTEYMLQNPGYHAIVPRIRTYIPESSMIGVLLDREESYTVIKSRQVSLLQHEPYSWEILGGSFVRLQEMSDNIVFMDKTIKKWIASMNREDREKFVDAVFSLLGAGGADQTADLIQPKNILAFFKALNADEGVKKQLSDGFVHLFRAAMDIRSQQELTAAKE